MVKVFRKMSEQIADFFTWSKFGLPVFFVGMLAVFGFGGGIVVSLLQ